MGGLGRRSVLGGGLALALAGPLAARTDPGKGAGYGMIGKMKAVPGKRAELVAVLTAGSGEMPGCLAYIVAEDLKEPDAIWITEIWTDKAAHDASLSLPAVREAIARGRPLIAGFELGAELRPVGDFGRQPA